MKKFLFLLAIIALLAVGCDDTGVTPTQSKCTDGCEQWQECDEEAGVCILKDGKCEKDDNCKDDTPICDLTEHICVAADKCHPNPCTVENKTKCGLVDGGDDGYVCDCDDGYELKEDKCVLKESSPCEPNPCTEENRTVCNLVEGGENPYECICNEGFILEEDKCVKKECTDACTEDLCDGDNIKKCEVNLETGCKELKDATSCGEHMSCDTVTNTCTCDNTCSDSTPTSCIGDNLVQCIADTNGCFYLDTKVCDSGCNDDGDTPFCNCEECIPAEFNSSCHTDNLGYTFCEDVEGCFSIKDVDCESGSHCDSTNGLSCIENDCTNDCSEGEVECKESGNASILVNCEVGTDGCYHKVDGANCTLLNMTCNDDLDLCLGANGLDICTDGEADILSSGLWYGTTKNMTDKYEGCRRNDDFNGLDTVYKINLTTTDVLNVKVKERGGDDISLGSIVPSIYIRKVCNGTDNQCRRDTASDVGETAELNFTATEDGLYYIIIDRKKGGIDMISGYDFEMLIDLQ